MSDQNLQKQIHPVLATTLGILCVSTASIFIRFAQDEASAIVIAASRLIVASLILVPIILIKHRGEWALLSRKEFGKAILSGVFLALHFTTWISSLRLTSIASSIVLVTTTPLWVALLSPIVLKEPIRKSVIAGLVVSMAGSIVVGLANTCQFQGGILTCSGQLSREGSMLGNLLALTGAWMAAGYILMGRQLRKNLTTLSYAGLVYGIAALVLIVIVFLRKEPVFSYSRQTYFWLAALGIVPQLMGHSLLNLALKYISAAYVSLTLLGEPIGTVILALIFLKESPTFLEGIGAVLILAGIVIASFWRDKKINAA
jgi:drug/metabolite transporter (DMT)-like permease